MSRAIEVLNEELIRVDYYLNNQKEQVEELRLLLADVEKTVARYEKLHNELSTAIAVVTAYEN